MSRRPTPIGLDWDAVTANYLAHGGELHPEVWKPDAPPPRRRGAGLRETPLERGEHGNSLDLSPAQCAEIAQRYDDGETSPALAAAFGVGSNTILRIAREVGVEIRSLKTQMAPEQLQALIDRYDEGESANDIAASLGKGTNTIRRLLVDAGVEIRDKSTAGILAKQRRAAG